MANGIVEKRWPQEQEIRKRHHQIEKKQLFVDRLNREYDEKRLGTKPAASSVYVATGLSRSARASCRTKLEAELGNDEDVAGPQEAKLKHMWWPQ